MFPAKAMKEGSPAEEAMDKKVAKKPGKPLARAAVMSGIKRAITKGSYGK